MARLSMAERNRRKRARKKERATETSVPLEDDTAAGVPKRELDIEIEYVPEDPVNILPKQIVERFKNPKESSSTITTASVTDDDEQRTDERDVALSKRKLRDMLRPSIAELKRRVRYPDLVEAHDVTSPDPDFLIALKGIPGTVPVPRHWGRKRKYLQGKRGFEKPPFVLPDFLVATGITELRDATMQSEAAQTAKQKNRARVNPKLGGIDVDYGKLHAAFFQHQTKPKKLTKFGDLYYEGKEIAIDLQKYRPGHMRDALRSALGMEDENSPPPWLFNMQRFGPPPSYPGLPIPGLTAPLPSERCQYGYHPGGWGKPPLDPYGRPVFGGNPLDPPGSKPASAVSDAGGEFVTSDGKLLKQVDWGALPMGESAAVELEESEEEEESEMEESSESEAEEGEDEEEGTISVMPAPVVLPVPTDLRKGTETEEQPAKVSLLYQVLPEKAATTAYGNAATVFASDKTYELGGVQSVLSKQEPAAQRSRLDDDEDDEKTKNFKF
jgi:splicing factor 3B subunit 2